MKNRWIAVLLASLLVLTAVSACGKNDQETTASTEASAESTSQDVTENPGNDESTSETGPDESESATDTTLIDFGPEDYSKGYADNGYVEGLRALDYVVLPVFSEIEIQESEIAPDMDTMAQTVSYFLTYYAADYTSVIEDGDTVNIDYTGYVDGVAFDYGSTNGSGVNVTIGVTQYVDDFLEQLIGHVPGDSFDVNVTFPENYGTDELKGKDAVFKTTVNFIVPDLTQELIDENPDLIESFFGEGIETVDDVQERLYDYYRDTNFQTKIQEILQDTMDSFDAPKEAMDVARNQMDINCQTTYGMTLSSFASYYGYSDSELETMIEDNAKGILIYQAIAEQEGWDYSEEDLKEQFGEDYDLYLSTYGKGYIAEYALYLKAWDYIEENVKVVSSQVTE